MMDIGWTDTYWATWAVSSLRWRDISGQSVTWQSDVTHCRSVGRLKTTWLITHLHLRCHTAGVTWLSVQCPGLELGIPPERKWRDRSISHLLEIMSPSVHHIDQWLDNQWTETGQKCIVMSCCSRSNVAGQLDLMLPVKCCLWNVAGQNFSWSQMLLVKCFRMLIVSGQMSNDASPNGIAGKFIMAIKFILMNWWDDVVFSKTRFSRLQLSFLSKALKK